MPLHKTEKYLFLHKMLNIRPIKSIHEFRDLEPAWNRITCDNEKYHIFQSFDWNYTWWKHFGMDFNLYILTVEKDNNEVIGICPLMWSRQHFGSIHWRKFEFIGKRFSNYHDILLKEEVDAQQAIKRLVKYLLEGMGSIDYVVLRRLPVESETVKCVKLALKALHAYPHHLGHDDTSRQVLLNGSFETYLNRDVPRKFRYDTERQQRRLNEQGALCFTECRDEKTVLRTLDRLFRMKIAQRRGKGEKSFFEEKNFQCFDKDISLLFLRKNRLFMHALQFNEAVIAVNCDFIYNRRIYCHVIAYENRFDKKFSPGRILQYNELKKAFALKMKAFDFAWGDAFYKRSWCNHHRRTRRVYLFKKDFLPRRYYLNYLRPILKHLYEVYCSPGMKQNLKALFRINP